MRAPTKVSSGLRLCVAREADPLGAVLEPPRVGRKYSIRLKRRETDKESLAVCKLDSELHHLSQILQGSFLSIAVNYVTQQVERGGGAFDRALLATEKPAKRI